MRGVGNGGVIHLSLRLVAAVSLRTGVPLDGLVHGGPLPLQVAMLDKQRRLESRLCSLGREARDLLGETEALIN